MSDFVKSLMNNEEWAYRQLVKEYGKRVFNMCYYILHDKIDAEDATQEVFISVYTSISAFREEAKFSTWIYRLTLNKCHEKLRYDSRKKRKGEMVSIELQAQLKDQNLSPENTLISKEEIDALFYAINLLPENQRIAYTLCNMNELTYVEISESMNLSISAVESLIFRAKKNLKKTLTDTITH